MAGYSAPQVIPSPNFGVIIEESALAAKANLWTQVLEQQRPQFYGSRKRNSDYYASEASDRLGGKKRIFQQRQDKASCNYYCDACDRGFKSDDEFKLHTSQHEKCIAKDCKYVAAPKLVKLHYDMQHKTGLAAKIRESSEDIQKWIEERRRNFPTAANIQRKAEELRERQERGEVLETKQFGKMRGRGRGRGNRQRGGYSRRGQHNNGRFPHSQETNTEPTHRNECENNDPLSKLADSVATTPNIAAQTQHNTSNPASSSAPTGLSCLLSNYADISSDDDEEKVPSRPVVKSEPCTSTAASTSDADTIHSSHNGSNKRAAERSQCKPRKGKGSMKGQQRQNDKNMKLSKSTLLEKLLANEIRHERNVLLQCVRYVVKQDFFGVGRKEKPAPFSCYKDDDVWE